MDLLSGRGGIGKSATAARPLSVQSAPATGDAVRGLQPSADAAQQRANKAPKRQRATGVDEAGPSEPAQAQRDDGAGPSSPGLLWVDEPELPEVVPSPERPNPTGSAPANGATDIALDFAVTQSDYEQRLRTGDGGAVLQKLADTADASGSWLGGTLGVALYAVSGYECGSFSTPEVRRLSTLPRACIAAL